MKRRTPTLPLGIDIGITRVRVALTVLSASGPELVAVAARDHDGDVRGALAEALADLETPERRCALALGAPDAQLHELELPAMPVWERLRATRFQAAQLIRYPVDEAALTLAPSEQRGCWILGIARRAAIDRAVAAVTPLRLRAIAVDDIALAMRRAFPEADGIIDIGGRATRIITFTRAVPRVATVPIGGDQLTAAIARALGIDAATAERRKRQFGFGGAGESERDLLVAAIADALVALSPDIMEARPQRIVLCGNGSRIPGLRSTLSGALGIAVARAPRLNRRYAPHYPPMWCVMPLLIGRSRMG